MLMDKDHNNRQYQTEKGFFCIENVFWSNGFYADTGDLFATTKGLYYICYCEFHHNGTLGGKFPALTLANYGNSNLGSSLNDQSNDLLSEISSEVAGERTRQVGIALAERVAKHQRSFFIPKDEISHLEVDVKGKMIQLFYRGIYCVFYAELTKKHAKDFQSFLDGTATPEIQGLDLTFPRPPDLLMLLANADDGEKDQIPFEEMAKNQTYLVELHYAFDNLQDPEKAAVCKGLEKVPWIFSSSLTNTMTTDISNQKREALLIGLFFLVLVLISGFFFFNELFDESFEIKFGKNTNFFGIIVTCCLYCTVKNLRKFLNHSEKLKRFKLYFKK